MVIGKRFYTIRIAGPIGAALAVFGVLFTTTSSYASPGCSALPGTFSINAPGNYGSGTGFSQGDTISATATTVIYLQDLTTSTALTPNNGSSHSFTYVVPANTPDTFTVTNPPTFGGSVTITCTPAASGNTNTNSQILRSLQNSITPVVANTSGQAITNAVDGGINDAFSPNGTPTSFGPTGGFINFCGPAT